MAQLTANWAGVVLILDHAEVDILATAEDVASALAGLGAAIPSPLAPAFAVIGAYIQVNRRIMQAVDQGNGVFLTCPWPAVWWGQWWFVVPTPR